MGNSRKESTIKFRLSLSDRRKFEQAAEKKGLLLSAWVRMVALDAVHAEQQQRGENRRRKEHHEPNEDEI